MTHAEHLFHCARLHLEWEDFKKEQTELYRDTFMECTDEYCYEEFTLHYRDRIFKRGCLLLEELPKELPTKERKYEAVYLFEHAKEGAEGFTYRECDKWVPCLGQGCSVNLLDGTGAPMAASERRKKFHLSCNEDVTYSLFAVVEKGEQISMSCMSHPPNAFNLHAVYLGTYDRDVKELNATYQKMRRCKPSYSMAKVYEEMIHMYHSVVGIGYPLRRLENGFSTEVSPVVKTPRKRRAAFGDILKPAQMVKTKNAKDGDTSSDEGGEGKRNSDLKRSSCCNIMPRRVCITWSLTSYFRKEGQYAKDVGNCGRAEGTTRPVPERGRRFVLKCRVDMF